MEAQWLVVLAVVVACGVLKLPPPSLAPRRWKVAWIMKLRAMARVIGLPNEAWCFYAMRSWVAVA